MRGAVAYGACGGLFEALRSVASPSRTDRSDREKENDMTGLSQKSCVPCRGGVPPLKGQALAELHAQLRQSAHWKVVDQHHITREFKFPDFKSALGFVNCVGTLAEEQGHHPDILLAWGRVAITLWTHKVDGLTESDFILAAKIDELPAV